MSSSGPGLPATLPFRAPQPATTAASPTANTNAAVSAPSDSRSSGRSSARRIGGTSTWTASSSHVLRTTSTESALAASNNEKGSASASAAAASGGRLDTSADGPKSAYSGPPSPRSSSSIMIAPPPRVALGAGSLSTPTGPQPGDMTGESGSANSGSNTDSGLTGGSSGSSSSGFAGGSGGGSGGGSASHASANITNYQRHQGRHMGQRSQHHSTSSVSSVVTVTSSSSSVAAAAAASLHAAAASAQLVKEKDLRIAQLEHELKLMESEFTRELDKLSKAESETAMFWQTKHNRLQQQMAQSDTAFQLLRAEVELREAERTELRAGWEDMQRAAIVRDEEIRALRSQVRGLKEWVSTATRPDGLVASDEVFGDGMARLANGLQNWVIVHFRRAKLDLERLDNKARDDLARLVPTHKDLVHSAKLQMLQSAVSRILVELIFEPYYVGLTSEQAAKLVEVESFLRQSAGAADPINQWRSLTLAIVSKDADKQLAKNTSQLTDDVVARVNGLLSAITAEEGGLPPHAINDEARDQALRQLVTNAVELARLLAVQKAMFRVFMPSVVPHQPLFFDGDTMEDIGGEEDDDSRLAQRAIACVTFPGIIKRGDETGSQLQYTNVICKARVLCAAE